MSSANSASGMRDFMEPSDYVLNFTGCVPKSFADAAGISFLDFSGLSGTHLFLDPEAGETIRRKIAPFGAHGIHFIDTGDYHYLSKLTAETAGCPFVLVLADHHTDMQEGAFGTALSCGDWAGALLRENKAAGCILIGPPGESIRKIPEDIRSKVLPLQRECKDADWNRAADFCKKLPVYISIDRDILRPDVFRTDWDQGDFSMEELSSLLLGVVGARRCGVIGIDICGGLGAEMAAYPESMRLNEKNNFDLYQFAARLIGRQ